MCTPPTKQSALAHALIKSLAKSSTPDFGLCVIIIPFYFIKVSRECTCTCVTVLRVGSSLYPIETIVFYCC